MKMKMKIEIGPLQLPGDLQCVPEDMGLVIFAHGSGSSRLSPRNRMVAKILNEAGLGTLLFDLLLVDEAQDSESIFNVPLLADRLLQATQWSQNWLNKKGIGHIPVGFFGASTGAAAALWAAADLKSDIKAIVSRGGRPDLASTRLQHVQAPTLLLVGSRDESVMQLNQNALRILPQGELVSIPNATHLFEEPGALEAVAEKARDWFLKYFIKPEQKAA